MAALIVKGPAGDELLRGLARLNAAIQARKAKQQQNAQPADTDYAQPA